MKFGRTSPVVWIALLVLAITGGGIFVGCGNNAPLNTAEERTADPVTVTPPPVETVPDPVEEDAPPQADSAVTEATAALIETAPSDDEGEITIARIAAEQDLFALHDMKEEYEQREDASQDILDTLVKRRDELVAEHERQVAIDSSLDLVAFRFEHVQAEEYLLRWYYIATDDITADWILKVSLTVDPSHIHLLPEDEPHREQGVMYSRVHAEQSDINTWRKGDHTVISLTARLQPIPFDVMTYFYQWSPEEGEIPANRIQHGWHADPEN